MYQTTFIIIVPGSTTQYPNLCMLIRARYEAITYSQILLFKGVLFSCVKEHCLNVIIVWTMQEIAIYLVLNFLI
jgi:hypothetical protein